uniref:CSON013634 protein n=1 Tax=Culicoides sonorensis TaxID=179676 RepID=A0A336LK39_CULSO
MEPKILLLSNGETRYACSQCGVKYKKMSALRSHFKECGRGATCPYCPKVVTQRRNLAKHIRTHTKAENSVLKHPFVMMKENIDIKFNKMP